MSLIDPSQFPVLQPEQAQTAAGQLRSMGQAIATHTTNADTHWQGLSTCYQAPEAGVVFNLLKPAVVTGKDLSRTMATAAGILESYGSSLASIRSRLNYLKGEAELFRIGVLNTARYKNYFGDFTQFRRYDRLPEWVYRWDQWPPTVEKNNALISEAAAIMADLSELEASYGQQILNLMADQSQLPIVCDGDSAFPVYEADAFLISPVPWGQPQKRQYASFTDNLISTTLNWANGTGAKLVGLAGFSWDWPPGFSPSRAAESWFGLGKHGIGAYVVLTNPASILIARKSDDPLSEAVNLYVSTNTGVVGYDYQAQLDGKDPWHQWRDDPQATMTNTVYNIVSLMVGAKMANFSNPTFKSGVWDVASNAVPLIPGQPSNPVTVGGPPLKDGETSEYSCPSAPVNNTTTSTSIPAGADRRDSAPVTTSPPEGPPTVTSSSPPTTVPPNGSEQSANGTTTTSTPTTSTSTSTTSTSAPTTSTSTPTTSTSTSTTTSTVAPTTSTVPPTR